MQNLVILWFSTILNLKTTNLSEDCFGSGYLLYRFSYMCCNIPKIMVHYWNKNITKSMRFEINTSSVFFCGKEEKNEWKKKKKSSCLVLCGMVLRFKENGEQFGHSVWGESTFSNSNTLGEWTYTSHQLINFKCLQLSS